MRAFIVAIACFVALLVVVSAGGLDATEKHCIPSQSYMEDCNNCHCDLKGSSTGCTRMMCPEYTPCTDGIMKRNEHGDVCICRKGVLFCYPSECKRK